MEARNDQVNIPIQLLSVCNTNGDLIPRWFRYEDQEHLLHTVQIEQVLAHQELEYVGMRMISYICQADMEERRRIFEIRYHVDSHKWSFFKMLD